MARYASAFTLDIYLQGIRINLQDIIIEMDHIRVLYDLDLILALLNEVVEFQFYFRSLSILTYAVGSTQASLPRHTRSHAIDSGIFIVAANKRSHQHAPIYWIGISASNQHCPF